MMIRPSGSSYGYPYAWLSTYAQRCNSGCPPTLDKHLRVDQIVISTGDIPPMP